MSRRKLLLAFVFTALATGIVYARVLTFDFVDFDDYQYITRNPDVASGISLSGLRWAFTSFYASNWHPLSWLSHMLDVELFGTHSGGHHFTSLLIHIVNTLLLLALLVKMTGALRRSVLVALLFALHPLHVESVAYIAERKDVLSAFFFFLTIAAYLRYVRIPGRGAYLLVLLAYVCGLLSKPMLVTLPFVLLLLDYWPLGRLFPRDPPTPPPRPLRLMVEKVPLLLLAAGSAAVTYLAQEQGGSVAGADRDSLLLQIGNALMSYVVYLQETLWPANLAPFYPFNPAAVTPLRVAAALLVLILLSWFFLWRGRRYRYLAVGWLWFLVTLIPVIGFVRVGMQAYADRYTYLPLIGVFLIIVWGGGELASRRRMKAPVVAVAAGTIVFAMAIAAWFQVGYWRNSFTLFERAAKVTTGNWLAHHNLGTAYMDLHRYPEALRHLREALRSRPDYPSAYNNIGNIFTDLDNRAEAIGAYREALQINPDFVPARRNLVRAYLRWGNREEAFREYLILRELAPDEAAKVWPQ